MEINLRELLPEDFNDALLVGRAWVPGTGPCLVTVRDGDLFDITSIGPTMSQLLNVESPAASVRKYVDPPCIGHLSDFLGDFGNEAPHILVPNDLQAIKAAGVTFAASMLERAIEEQARGDAAKADGIRKEITALFGEDLSQLTPGSEAAVRLKEMLIEKGAWSQYLEVGIGPDAEIFTKSQPLSAVGYGAQVGIHPLSTWNNPEPEVVLAVNGRQEIVGATLGNDVNLRDFEGRSALLLGKAKDNNGSCAIGPFIRLFDADFCLDHLRRCVVRMEVKGADGFLMTDESSMALISRDPADIVEQASGQTHQYPDGFMLFLGTMFAPTQDRDAPGMGFTHKVHDEVTIRTPKLGALTNKVNLCTEIPPWTFGITALMKNLARRGLLD